MLRDVSIWENVQNRFKTSLVLALPHVQSQIDMVNLIPLFLLWLTFCFAGLSDRVHLVSFVALAFKIPFVVYADLATGIRVLTLINIYRDERIINQLRDKNSQSDSDSKSLILPCELWQMRVETKFRKCKYRNSFQWHDSYNREVKIHILWLEFLQF